VRKLPRSVVDFAIGKQLPEIEMQQSMTSSDISIEGSLLAPALRLRSGQARQLSGGHLALPLQF
jgi:hypothetical protein